MQTLLSRDDVSAAQIRSNLARRTMESMKYTEPYLIEIYRDCY